jgi:iron complex outermembrane recepter protein
MVNKRIVIAGIGAVTLVCLQGEAFAQAASEDLQEVVVTAQRREQNLQDVPVAVSVVTGAELERINVKSLQDVSNYLGNVKITTGTLTNPINVRGIGSGNNSGFEQSVATFADGVYRPRSRSTNAALFDLERVEILKGPQTTFFGANAIAGALNITTRKPGKVASRNASVLYAFDDGEYNIEGGVTLPFSDALSVRFAARVSGMDGYMTLRDGSVHGPNDKSLQGRFALRWEPSENFRSDFRLDAGHSRTDDAVPLEVIGCPPGAPYPAPLPPVGAPTNCALALITNPNLESKLDFHSNSPFTWAEYDFIESAWTNSWKLGAGSLTSISAYFKQESNNRTQLVPLSFPNFTVRGYDPLPSDIRENYHQFSQELRFQSDTGGAFEYMFGAYYAKAKWDNTSSTGFYFIPFGAILSGPPFNMPTTPDMAFTGLPHVTTDDTTTSAFASATFRVSDQFRINAGARYSSIRKEGIRSLTFGTSVNNDPDTFVPFTNPAFQAGACAILVCDNNPFTPAKLTDSKFMPSLGVQYDLTDDVMTYATYTNGFKAGGFSGAATANTFGPEDVDAFEVGIKGVYLDRRLTVNADVFRMSYSGLQETAYSQTLASTVLNAAKSVSQGVELNATLRATSHLTFRTDLAYLDSKYKDFTNAPCTSLMVLQTPPRGTCRRPDPANAGQFLIGQDMSGKTRAYSPEWSGSLSASLQLPLAQNVLRIDPSVYFTTDFFMTASGDPLLSQGGFTKYDLRLGYGPEDSHWELALVGKNLGNKETLGVMLEMPGSQGTVLGVPERGRSVALQFSYRN